MTGLCSETSSFGGKTVLNTRDKVIPIDDIEEPTLTSALLYRVSCLEESGMQIVLQQLDPLVIEGLNTCIF